MGDNVLSYSIRIEQTDEQKNKLASLKKSIIESEIAIKNLKEATKGNADAQKEYAGTLSQLEAHLKEEKKLYNELHAQVQRQTDLTNSVAGSYDYLVKRQSILSAELRAMPIDETNEKFIAHRQEIASNQAQMNKYNESISRFQGSVGNYPKALVSATKGLQGFSQIADTVSRVLGVNTQAITDVAIAANGLVHVAKDLKDVKEGLAAATKIVTVTTGAESAAEVVNAASKQASAASTVELTIAEKALNVVRGLSIGLVAGVATGIAALTAIIYGYIDANKKQKEVEEENNRIEKKINEERKEISKSKVDRLAKEYEQKQKNLVLEGKITELEAEKNILLRKYAVEEKLISLELEQELKKINDDRLNRRISGDTYLKRNTELRGIATEKEIELEKRKAVDLASINEKIRKDERDKTGEFIKDLYDANVEAHEENVKSSKKSAEEKKKIIEDNEKKIQDLLNDNIKKALEIYKEDSKNFIDEWKKKNKEAQTFYDKVDKMSFDNAVKEAELSKDKIAIENARFQKALNDLTRGQVAEIIKTKEFQKAKELLEKEHRSNLENIKKEFKEVRGGKQSSVLSEFLGVNDEEATMLKDGALAIMEDIGNSILETQRRQLENKYQMDEEFAQAGRDRDLDILKNQLDKGLITEQEYKQRSAQAESLLAQKKQEIKRKEFEENKKLKLKELSIQTAQTIASIWLQALMQPDSIVTFGASGAIRAGIMSAVALAQSGVQLSLIHI
jgi:hypothetical protein